MAMFSSSILSELTSRSISFLIDKCLRQTSPPTVEETLSNLQRLLFRVQVIVEEADERHISNHAMLRQLSQIRKEMYRGYHSLDTFRCRGAHEEENRLAYTTRAYRCLDQFHSGQEMWMLGFVV
ncbi:uncharacterized protein [Miscanthus floridulus]|uniref:uncharacterized protein n=1 Tax=Miscanthus floridulus TaxID=154761 RepID=UPI003458CF65